MGSDIWMADSKHLEFLQAAIARMAGHSFLAKGWSITLTTVCLGVAVNQKMPYFALLALLPVFLFAVVDAFYLTLERGFRARFKAAARVYAAGNKPDFEMSPGWSWGAHGKSLLSPSVYLIHAPLALVLAAAFLLLRKAI